MNGDVEIRGAREFLFFLSDVRNIFSCPSWFRFYHVQYSVRRIEGAYRVFHALRGSGIRWRLFVFFTPSVCPRSFRFSGQQEPYLQSANHPREDGCFKQEIMMLMLLLYQIGKEVREISFFFFPTSGIYSSVRCVFDFYYVQRSVRGLSKGVQGHGVTWENRIHHRPQREFRTE